jgi:hypothetical protein
MYGKFLFTLILLLLLLLFLLLLLLLLLLPPSLTSLSLYTRVIIVFLGSACAVGSRR